MGRTPYWLIDHGFLIDVLALPTAVVFAWGVRRHLRRVAHGQVRLRWTIVDLRRAWAALPKKPMLLNGLLGVRLYREPLTGIFHGLVFWPILVLLCGSVLVLIQVLFGLPVLSGWFYKWFMAFGLDAAGAGLLAGIGFLLVRRLSGRERLVEPKARPGFAAAEVFILLVVLTGFVLEGSRIGLSGAREPAFIGNLAARLLSPAGGGSSVYITLWWLHGLLALALLAWLPFSPLSHLFLVPVNAGLPEEPIGADVKAMDPASLEPDAEGNLPHLGTSTMADCSLKRRLDFSTCLWCGRCQEVCPATLTGKNLSPKGVMITLAEWLSQGKMADTGLIDAIGMSTLFECRTCGACVETCPAMVNPLKAIWGMRQNLMMERGEMPVHMLTAYRNLEALMHPFATSVSLSEWRRGLSVPKFAPGETEYLLWIGCAVTYEARAQQVGRAMVDILDHACVSYGIIEEARCTGDPAKQMGDDYLFATLAKANIELFAAYGVKKIITLCPHCFNSFKNYYPPLGASYEVIPHPVMIESLIRSGRISLMRGSLKKIAYHDPCYLGRHNRLFEPPRNVIRTVGELTELPRQRGASFCCGAGGGNYWNEEEGQRINYARAEEAFNSGAEALAAACPFCLLMLTDGMKMYTDRGMVFDIAEIVARSLQDDGGQGGESRE